MRVRLSAFILLALLIPTRTYADGHNVDGAGGFSRGGGGSELTGWYQTLAWAQLNYRYLSWVLPDISVQFRDDVTQVVTMGGPRMTFHPMPAAPEHKIHVRGLLGAAYTNQPLGSDTDFAFGGGVGYEYVPGSVKTSRGIASKGLGFRVQVDRFKRSGDRDDSFTRFSAGLSYWFPAP